MGIRKSIWYLGICVIILFIGCNVALGSDTPGMKDSGFLMGNISGDLFSPDIPDVPLLHEDNTYRALQAEIRSGDLKSGPDVTSSGTGWQNITMPALISEPGNYRVVNDYSGSEGTIGLAINSSDVHIDGNGHTYRGNYNSETYGIAAASDTPISNISVINFNTEKSSGGIVFLGVEGGEISDTHHTESLSGISMSTSKSIHLARNSVSGYRMDNSSQNTIGIAGMGVTDVSIESNSISNISPSMQDVHSNGISLITCTNSKITGNEISGSATGILISSSDSVNISHNTVFARKMDESGGEIVGISAIDATNVSIESNSISNTKSLTQYSNSIAISLLNCIHSEILRNEIAGMTDFGILCMSDEGEHVDILNNRIISPGFWGIYVSDGSGVISNNDIGGGLNGVLLTMDDTVISNNHIHDSLQKGLSILGTNLTITQNNLTNNTYNFYIDGNRDDHYLHHIDRTNLINGRPLVYIRDGSGVRIGPEDNPAMVLVAQSNNVTIQNISTGANMAGIVLADVTNATISDVTDTASMAGFGASRSKGCTLSNVSVSKSLGYGFDLIEDADMFLDRCRVSETSGIGYYLLDSKNIGINSCNSTDLRQDYSEGQTYGVLIDNSRSVLIQNFSTLNSRHSGISAYNTDGLGITNSDISDNNEYGFVCVRSSQITVNNSAFYNSTLSGIALDSLSGFGLNRNYIHGSEGYGLSLLNVSDGLITDNSFNNIRNVEFVSESTSARWNTTLTPGRNIVAGTSLGGNFWADPDGKGFSQTHADRGDGICNASYVLNDKNVDYFPLAVPSEEIIPDFTADQNSGTPPLTVRFTDTSAGYLTQWNWTFGDGTGSHEQNPVHTYTGIGRYSVTLEGTGQNGRSGMLRKAAFIEVHSGRITGPNGMLWVDSTPQNGSIFIDERYIGSTPLQASGFHAGSHQIMITHEGYQNWSGTVWIHPDQYTYVPRVILRKEYQ